LTKEVEEIITELMRTQPEVVIRTALQENHQLVLTELIDYAADSPTKQDMLKDLIVQCVSNHPET